MSIYIPAGALPEGKKQEVYFKVCQDSKYMPPLDSGSGKNITKNYSHVASKKRDCLRQFLLKIEQTK